MGLHIHTNQDADQALLKIAGDLKAASLRQLEAAVQHFQSRGCKIIRIEHDFDAPVHTWAHEVRDVSDLIAIRQD
ncbi:MAG: hypothetical protein H6506_00245 [Calditrichaeota bacterium]|nr:hypothetical protein [Calditrichota bacterium]MCB9391069.1 hypothetical protein [Calditrichota bacterium]